MSRLTRGPRRNLPTLGLVLAVLLWPAASRAASVVADLTSHVIAITTGFNGASVVLFGAVDGPGDIVVTVRGPERTMTVRQKSRILGVWVNTEAIAFLDVPGFYAVAANRPLDKVVSPATAAHYRLGVDNLGLKTEFLTPALVADAFAAALVRRQQQAGLFADTVGQVDFLDERLFRTTIAVPSNVPTGAYRVDVLLVRDREVVARRTTPLTVSKAGVDAAVFDFANRRPGLYGAIAVLIAAVAGWVATLPFRNA